MYNEICQELIDYYCYLILLFFFLPETLAFRTSRGHQFYFVRTILVSVKNDIFFDIDVSVWKEMVFSKII